MRTLSLILVLGTLLFSCSKEKESTIPSVPVNFRINLDDPAYNQLTSVGGSYTFYNVGNRGIIVYRKAIAEYVALERTCSYQSTDTCAYVSIDTTISSVGCKCCGSRFQLLDGSPIKGPANASLRLYQTNLIDGYLYIYN